MRLIGSRPGPNGRFIKGGTSYGGPGGSRMIGDHVLTVAERQQRRRDKIGTAAAAAAAYAAKMKWQKANPEKHRASNRRRMLKKYGLTPESYDQIWISQGYACAVCRSTAPNSSKGWQVDHCHATGKVRGILCSHCNRMLAGAVDNPEHLIRGLEYLKKAMVKAA